MARLGTAFRVIQDLDALLRPQGGASGLEVLRAAGATDVNEIGGLVATVCGDVRVDVLGARPDDLCPDFLCPDFTDAVDRLEAMAHQWALDTATPAVITATDVAASVAEANLDETSTRPTPLRWSYGPARWSR